MNLARHQLFKNKIVEGDALLSILHVRRGMVVQRGHLPGL